MSTSAIGKATFDKIMDELNLLRENKASVQWVESRERRFEKSVSDLWKSMEKARIHRCIKEDTLKMVMDTIEVMPTMRENISSWIFFRNIFLGAFGTLLVLGITAVIAFAGVKVETENTKKEIEKQAAQILSFRSDVEEIKELANGEEQQQFLYEVKTSLQKIEEALVKKKKKKKKK